MKVSCDVIQDLLPLYAEDMVSEDSKHLVENHLMGCERCHIQLQGMMQETVVPFETNQKPFIKIQRTLRKKKIQTIIISILFSLILVIATMSYLTAPEFHPYDAEQVTVSQQENGNVVVEFGEAVTGYTVEQSFNVDRAVNTYFISTWTSIWGRFRDERPSNVVLNPNGEVVDTVLYDASDSKDSQLIYGGEQLGSAGIVPLPRLYFLYYLTIAIFFLGVLLLVAFFNRNNTRAKDTAIKCAMLPIAYICGHLLIKGFTFSSYSALRDLSAIVLITIPLFLALLVIFHLVAKKDSSALK